MKRLGSEMAGKRKSAVTDTAIDAARYDRYSNV